MLHIDTLIKVNMKNIQSQGIYRHVLRQNLQVFKLDVKL